MKLSIVLPAFFVFAGIQAMDISPKQPQKEGTLPVAENTATEEPQNEGTLVLAENAESEQAKLERQVDRLAQSFVFLEAAQNQLALSMIGGAGDMVPYQPNPTLFEMVSSFLSNAKVMAVYSWEQMMYGLDMGITAAEAFVDFMKTNNTRIEVMADRVDLVQQGLYAETARSILLAFRLYKGKPDIGQGTLLRLLVTYANIPEIMQQISEKLSAEDFAMLTNFMHQHAIQQ